MKEWNELTLLCNFYYYHPTYDRRGTKLTTMWSYLYTSFTHQHEKKKMGENDEFTIQWGLIRLFYRTFCSRKTIMQRSDVSFADITMAKKITGQLVLLISANQKAWSIKNSWPLERSSKNLSNATLLVSVAFFV